MNKFIIFSCLVVAISSLCSNATATNWTDCYNKTLEDVEKTGYVDSCCYFLLQEKDNSTIYQLCAPFQKAKVNELVKVGKKTYKTYSIDCSSNWISYSLFLIALIFMI